MLLDKPICGHQCVPPCVAKTCVVRPVLAWVAGERGAADPVICSKGPCQKGTIARASCNPTFAQEKKAPLWRFSAYFPVFKAEEGPKKSAPNPGYQ